MSASAPPCQTLEWTAPSGHLVCRVYPGGAAGSKGLLVFFPPGGFGVADLEASDACLKEFAQACQVTILAPGYAVAPDHPFPAAVEDTHALLCHLAANPAQVAGWTGARLFVGGIEAGGNLAAVSALICRDRLGPGLAGQILMMPMLDPSMTVCAQAPGAGALLPAMADAYRSYLPRLSDRVHPYACPLQSSRLAGLPPALLIYVHGDPLGAEARVYGDKLAQAGVAVQHVELAAVPLADAEARCDAAGQDASVTAVADFIAAHLKKPARRKSP